MLWKIGVRKPRELADIEWEDVSEDGVTKLQFKALQRIGRDHAAPSSDSTKLTPPTPGYETAKGELGLDQVALKRQPQRLALFATDATQSSTWVYISNSTHTN